MDRDQVKAVQNQKVFVPLSAVMEVTENFNRLMSQIKAEDINNLKMTNVNYTRGMASVIRTLGLPITIPNGY